MQDNTQTNMFIDIQADIELPSGSTRVKEFNRLMPYMIIYSDYEKKYYFLNRMCRVLGEGKFSNRQYRKLVDSKKLYLYKTTPKDKKERDLYNSILNRFLQNEYEEIEPLT